jgi:hypothetical protein
MRTAVRLLIGALATASLVVVIAGQAVLAAPAAGACQLQGTAHLSPGLASTSQAFTYDFTGNLTGCQSNVAGAPATGVASAGVQVPETVTLTNSTGGTTTGTVQYQEPLPSGSGSCGSSTTSGQSLSQWADGTNTVVAYTTSGSGPAVALVGTVQPSMTLSLVASSVPAGWTAPATFTIATTRFAAGNSAVAPLTFSPTDTSQNCATVPVTSASINGVVSIGTAS